MNALFKRISSNKFLSAFLIASVTVIYLLSTSVLAQNGQLLKENNIFEIDYARDQLSFGDLWEFNSSVYTASSYAGPAVNLPNANVYEYYTSNAAQTSTTSGTVKFDAYYGSISYTDHAAPTLETPVTIIPYESFFNGYMPDSAEGAKGYELFTIKPFDDETAKYTVIPNSKGYYRIYVYSTTDPEGQVGYYLIDSIQNNNKYALGEGKQFPEFTSAQAPNWWYAEIKINNIGWTAAYPSCTLTEKEQNAGSSGIEDTIPEAFASGPLTNTTLEKEYYYYNVWESKVVQFNTLLTIEWEGDIELATITKRATISITKDSYTDNNDPYTGTAELTNIFGDSITVSADVTNWNTVHAPFALTAHPAEDVDDLGNDSVFKGIDSLQAEKGWYKFEDSDQTGDYDSKAIALVWEQLIPFPTVTVTYGNTSVEANFYADNHIPISTTMGTVTTYTVTLDFSNAAVDKVSYKLVNGVDVTESEFSATANAISVTVANDNLKLELTLENYPNTCTLEIVPSMAGVGYNVQNVDTGTRYQFIEDALYAADEGHTIILLDNVSFRDDVQKESWKKDNAGYTVRKGVTLLLPYAAGKYSTGDPTDENEPFPYANYTLTEEYSDLSPETGLYVTLTVPQNITVYNDGLIAVGGTVSGTSAQGYGGACAGSHSNLVVDGTLKLRSDSVLSVVGYLLGSGKVTTEKDSTDSAVVSNANIYQMFTILDFLGGVYMVPAAGNNVLVDPLVGSSYTKNYAVSMPSGESMIMPFTRYAMLGIQATIVLTQGNYVQGYCDLYAGDRHNQITSCIIGDDENTGLIILADGATITAEYDATTYVEDYDSGATQIYYSKIGRTTLSITGGGSLGSLQLGISINAGIATFSVNVDSSTVAFGIPYNYKIVLLGRSASDQSDYKIECAVNLFPGSELIVGQNAHLTVNGRMAVYEGLVDVRKASNGSDIKDRTNTTIHTRTYPTTSQLQSNSFGGNGTANLIIDGGTLTLGEKAVFGGLIQTTGSGSLNVDSNATLSIMSQFGATGDADDILTYDCRVAGACVFNLTGQIIDPTTGTFTSLTKNANYTAIKYDSAIGTYSYTMYPDSSDIGVTALYTESLGANVRGAWYIGTIAPELTTTEGSESAVAKLICSHNNTTTYYTTLQAAVAAAIHPDDVVELCKSITLHEAVAVFPLADDTEKKGITINLKDFAVTCEDGLLSNSGIVTLILGDSTVKPTDHANEVSGGANNTPAINNLGGGILTLKTGTASIIWGNAAANMIAPAVIYNHGTMEITGTGTIENAAVSMAGIGVGGYFIYYASVVHNTGELKISNVTLKTNPTLTNNYISAIINHMGNISSISGVKVNGGGTVVDPSDTSKLYGSYAIYNLGGTIDTISGGKFEGRYGIYNQNIRKGVQFDKTLYESGKTDFGFEIAHYGVIKTIDGLETDVTIYAIYNRGTIGTICGSTNLVADSYAVYNSNGWYYDTPSYKYYQYSSNGGVSNGTAREYLYGIQYDFSGMEDVTAVLDEDGKPTLNTSSIGSIVGSTIIETDGVKMDNSSSFALVNQTYVGIIGEQANITSKYRYALRAIDGGYVARISGNASFTAYQYTVEVTGQGTDYYINYRDADYKVEHKIDYFYDNASRIESIFGDSSKDAIGVKITSTNTYGLNIAGEVGSIGGKVAISSSGTAINLNANGAAKTKEYTRTWNGSTETGRKNIYKYDPAHIGSIGASDTDKVTITVSGDNGINVNGLIDLIGPGVTVTASRYAINVSYNRVTAYTETITSVKDDTVTGHYGQDYYLTKYQRDYSHDAPPTITRIKGATLNTTHATNDNYTVRNYGYIGLIEDAIINCKTKYAISNVQDGAYKSEDNSIRRTWNYYLGKSLFSTTNSQFNKGTPTDGTVYRYQSSIGTIRNCTITAASYGIINNGKISLIEGTTIATTGERAISNTGGSFSSSTYEFDPTNNTLKDGAANSAVTDYTHYIVTTTAAKSHTSLDSAEITTIGEGNTFTSTTNTVINSGRIGIIDSESGDNVQTSIIKATAGVALYNYQGVKFKDDTYHSAQIGTVKNVYILGTTYAIKNGDGNGTYTNVYIGELGEGLVAIATNSTGYGAYSFKNASVGKITGGDYYSGSGKREYAINLPDKQPYPDNYGLSTVTREVKVGEQEYPCYFVHIHSKFKDGVCVSCDVVKFYATNINMGDDLDLLFAISTSAHDDWTGCKAVFKRNGAIAQELVYSDTLWVIETISGSDYFVFTYGDFAAKEMCEEVTIIIYDSTGKPITMALTTSIQKYAMNILAKSSNELLKTTVVDMLNYGAACQNFFGYHTDNLATAQLTAAHQDLATKTTYRTENSTLNTPDSSGSTYWHATQLVTDGSIWLRFAFDADVKAGMKFSYSFTGHKGNTVMHEETMHTITAEEIVTIDGTQYFYGTVNTLVTADAGLEDFAIEVKVYDADGNEVNTFTESLMDYVMRMGSVAGTDVYTMLMRFSQSAFAYQEAK